MVIITIDYHCARCMNTVPHNSTTLLLHIYRLIGYSLTHHAPSLLVEILK